jgi:hypothetical protein
MRHLILIVLVLSFLTALPTYSQNGAAFSPLQPVVLKSASGHNAEVNELGQLHTVMRSMVCPLNTSRVPLASGAVFVGSASELLDYAEVSIAVYSDVASALDGLKIEFSSNGVDWFADGDNYTIAAGKSKSFSFQPPRRYFKVTYTNGGLPQTVFDIETILHKTRAKPSSHRMGDNVVLEDDAELVKAGITAEDTDTGLFTNIRAVQGDSGYNLKVSLDQVEPTTNSVQVIDYAHGELHEGKHYQVFDTANLAKAGVRNILLIASDSLRWPHTTLGVGTNDAAVIVEFFEGATYSATGTAAVTPNRNRNSVYTAGLRVFYTPTITGTGTATLFRKALGSGKIAGGQARDDNEIILKQNTAYLLRITEGNVAATNINWEIDWYEHTNKN